VGHKAIYAGPAFRLSVAHIAGQLVIALVYAIDPDHWQQGGLAGDVYWRVSLWSVRRAARGASLIAARYSVSALAGSPRWA
jgi:hypothetical protein